MRTQSVNQPNIVAALTSEKKTRNAISYEG